MAKPIEALSIQLKFKDAGSQAVIEKVKGSLKRLEIAASGAKPNIKGLRDEILAQGRASIKSVSNINAQRNALMALRDEAKIGGNTFKQLTADIKKLDAQLGKTSKKSGGMGARRATQTAGAIISGGIFGGPEGAIGGALGAFGGVEGAFAGAAIGAQIGMLRQAVGEMANYAASIEKAKIALNGILPNQNEYNFALQVAEQATRNLNVPQEQSIRGITRLSAAVTGAGGPVQDAALTFRNVTAAIKATGGSSEDVQGAITAMVQVFSKGKVSAEELSGQLGERLPGAVTMFAKANNMTLPELQKNLKAGTVGLNELMNFIVELGNTYNSTAEKISGSNAEAGARLSVAIRDMQADVGAALIPIGAQFQAAFAEFIREITPTLVAVLPKIGRLFLALAKNLDTLAVAALAAFGVFGIAKLTAIATGIGGITKAIATLKAGMVALGLANPFTAIAITVAALAGHIYNAAKEQKRLNLLIREGTAAQVQPVLTQKEQELDALLKQKIALGGGTGPQAAQFQEGGQAFKREQRLRQDIADLRERLFVAPYDETQGADLDLNLLRGAFKYKPVTEEDEGGNKSLARRIEQAQRLEAQTEAQLRLAQAQGAIGRVLAQQANQRASLQARINKLVGDGTNATINEAAANAKSNLESKQKLELQSRINKLYEQAKRPLETIVQRIKDKVNGDKMYKRLIAEGVNPELAKELVNIDKAFKAGLRKLDANIENLKAQKLITGLTAEELQNIEDQIAAIERKKKALEGEKTEADKTARATIKEPTFMEGLDQAIKDQEKALKDLINPLNQVLEAANAIGEAFKTSFKGIIDGSMTAREALASFFQSIADHFADMAAQIAAEAIKLAALKFVQMIVGSMFSPAAGAGGGASAVPSSAYGDFSVAGPSFFAKDGAYVSGGFKAFSQGGIVSQPTLGMVGEGGEPEYIIPQSKMRESMSRYSRGVRGSGVIPDGGGATAASSGGAAVDGPIDVRYTVERINSVDYVTADQFQAGMRQAANQGAKQGEQQTLKRLQMSSGTRKRIGM